MGKKVFSRSDQADGRMGEQVSLRQADEEQLGGSCGQSEEGGKGEGQVQK